MFLASLAMAGTSDAAYVSGRVFFTPGGLPHHQSVAGVAKVADDDSAADVSANSPELKAAAAAASWRRECVIRSV